MGIQTDVDRSRVILKKAFNLVWDAHLAGRSPTPPPGTEDAADVLFATSVQSYREALIGSILAKLCDASVDVTLPYAGQGDQAYNGRQIDEAVVNPFLQENRIPCSKGPYLAVFRRNVQFTLATREGLRDKKGYDAFLHLIEFVKTNKKAPIERLLENILWRFLVLREQGTIEISKIQRLSLEQYSNIIELLLDVPSGGLIPVLLSTAMLHTLSDCFKLGWEIQMQGINTADKASNAGGDVTIRQKGEIILAIEITERIIDKNRVISTFNTKISPTGLSDYLFLYTKNLPAQEARKAAFQYFSQGHDVNFLSVMEWILNCLGTVGSKCRVKFTEHLIRLLCRDEVPPRVKLAWNRIVGEIVS